MCKKEDGIVCAVRNKMGGRGERKVVSVMPDGREKGAQRVQCLADERVGKDGAPRPTKRETASVWPARRGLESNETENRGGKGGGPKAVGEIKFCKVKGGAGARGR